MKLIHNCKGQALVEMALILPFLLILVIAIVEGGVILNRQLTVVNAAREGARFGAFGAEPKAIHAQTLLAASRMLDEDDVAVTVILAEVNEPGTDFSKWEQYPEKLTTLYVTRQEMFRRLSQEGNVNGLQLVVVDIKYQHESVLGLPILGALVGKIPVGSWTVMRVHGLKGE